MCIRDSLYTVETDARAKRTLALLPSELRLSYTKRRDLPRAAETRSQPAVPSR